MDEVIREVYLDILGERHLKKIVQSDNVVDMYVGEIDYGYRAKYSILPCKIVIEEIQPWDGQTTQ